VRPALLFIAALLLGMIGFQVVYARTYATNVTLATKVVWGINIGLLTALVVGLLWFALGPGAR
jgi:hypothetical protein